MDRYVGKRLDGRYEIQEIIGVGGMAVVYKAYDSIEDRTVAVKILKEEFVANEEFLRRFKNESKAISVLSHPNIVKVFDVSFGDLIQYIVMEYIDGITLKEYIERQGSLRWKDAVHFTIQILRALQHAHDKGIVHRDVKPQNIMLLPDGTIKVTDFGIARFARSEHRTMTDKAIGSVHYISPEQARGEVTDEKADIYSVGVMLYEMLTGRLPFQAESAVSVAIMQLQTEPQHPREINGSIPLGLEQITMHAMQKEPVRRYQSAAEMLRDLEEFKRDPAVTFDYTYFVDTSPTKYVTGTLAAVGSEAPDEEEQEEETERKSPIVPALAGIAVAFVLGLVALGIFVLPSFFSKTADVQCPTLVGVNFDSIKTDPAYSGFTINAISWDHNNDYAYGVIYDQEPAAGRSIKKSSTINVKVSTGPKSIKVPDVNGYDIATAVSTLKGLGFTINQVEIQDEKIAKDRVVKTVPAAGESIAEGAEVTVYISNGPPTVYVNVPSIIGLTEAAAKQMIIDAGLTIGKISTADNTAPQGTVLSQDPNPTKVKQTGKGNAVDFTISTGNAPGYTLTLTVDLPSDYIANPCVVSAWIDGQEVANSGKIDLQVRQNQSFTIKSTSPTGTVRIKLDNDNYRDYAVDFETGTFSISKEYSYPTASPSSSHSSSSGSDDRFDRFDR